MTLHCSSTKYSQQKDDGCGMSSILNNKHVPCRSRKLHTGVEQVPREEPPGWNQPASHGRERWIRALEPARLRCMEVARVPNLQPKHSWNTNKIFDTMWSKQIPFLSTSLSDHFLSSVRCHEVEEEKTTCFQVMILVTKSY